MIYLVSLTLHSIMNNFIVDPSIWHYSVISKLNRILYHSFKTLIEYGEKIQFLKIATNLEKGKYSNKYTGGFKAKRSIHFLTHLFGMKKKFLLITSIAISYSWFLEF